MTCVVIIPHDLWMLGVQAEIPAVASQLPPSPATLAMQAELNVRLQALTADLEVRDQV